MVQFVLNDYHRNLSDDELLDDVKNVAFKLNKTSLTIDEYNKFGMYHNTTLTRRFGSWKEVLKKAGLSVENKNFRISDDEYLKDLRNVALLLGQKTVLTSEYTKYGKYGSSKLSKRFGGWNNALLLAGLSDTGFKNNITEIELYEEIENLWISLGRQPTTTDVKAGCSKFSLNTYSRHFGSWRNALESFVNYINSDNNTYEGYEIKENKTTKVYNEENAIKHSTKRDVNLRLRFLVMKRDNFKCCICGASPAKDSTVELHVDHIVPWDKGGETEINNLQTLCSKCNLGKSDLNM